MVSPDPSSPTPSTSSAMKTPDPQSPGPSASLVESEETPQGYSDAPEQQLKEISKWNTPLISCAVKVWEL